MAKLQGRDRRHGRRATRLALAALVLGCAAFAARPALAQDDDWEVVTPQAESQPDPPFAQG